VGLSLALPAAASANDFQDVYRDYKRSGTIKPCKFSNTKLENAERQTPPDVEQYAPSFLDALQNAREGGADCGKQAQAPAPSAAPTPSGGAPTPSTPTPAPQPDAQAPAASPTAPAATTPAPTVPVQPRVNNVPSPPLERVREQDDAPAPVWLLAALAALVVLFAVFAGLAWWFGWSADRFTRPWRASWGDFGGRLADSGSELRDWLRTGH
jgi:hypothetical protein